MITLIAFIFVLGFLVFVHEFGHFVVAKWIGVRVHTFSIGFGKRLAGFSHGDTDYRLSAIPLGGYVRMAGENPGESLAGTPDEFASRSVGERAAIIFAGPFMNLLWAVIFIGLVFLAGIEQPAYLDSAPVIGYVEPGSPAERAGIQPEDVLSAVEGKPVVSWKEVAEAFGTTGEKTLEVSFLRNGEQKAARLSVTDSLAQKSQGFYGMAPSLEPIIGSIQPGWPAEKAGLQPQDRIVKIAADSITDWNQMTRIIHAHPNDTLKLEALRNGQKISVTITPRKDEATGNGYIGIVVEQDVNKIRFGLGESLERSINVNWQMAVTTLGYVWRVVTGQVSGSQIGGPIMIAQVAGEAARRGIIDIFQFMGMLSLQLAILNLLPIPILDGGHLVFLTIEGITRRPLSARKREIAQIIGLVVLVLIMVYAFHNDISRFFSK